MHGHWLLGIELECSFVLELMRVASLNMPISFLLSRKRDRNDTRGKNCSDFPKRHRDRYSAIPLCDGKMGFVEKLWRETCSTVTKAFGYLGTPFVTGGGLLL